MKIEQIYTGCLAQGAYYISSKGEAAIIDPLREVSPYLQRAKADEAKIKFIFETHFHADFVSGHLDLSKQTGAPIIYGPNAQTKFESVSATDGQEFKVGDLTIVALHTPGHTLESTTYLLKDKVGKDTAIFTGDTLFLGDVGRPDLAQKSANLTQDQLAGMLYESLRSKIMPLADDVTVYPAHGAGSACGKNMMKETVDSLGNQKKMNYALRADMTKEEFIKEVTDGLAPPPAYFPDNVKLNKEGYESMEEVLSQGLTPLSADEFEDLANRSSVLMLDVRHESDFKEKHIPNSIFIGLDGSFAPWVGALIKDVQQKIILIVDEGREQEAITRLSRVGFDQSIGYLKGGINAWEASGRSTDKIDTIQAEELFTLSKDKKLSIFDVRKDGEYNAEHIQGAIHAPLSKINDFISEMEGDEMHYIHCAGGYRSVIAISILKSRGVHHLCDVDEGFRALKETAFTFTVS